MDAKVKPAVDAGEFLTNTIIYCSYSSNPIQKMWNKKALLIEPASLKGAPFLQFIGEALEWPKVEGFEIVASVRLDEIEQRLLDEELRRRLKGEEVDAILFVSGKVFGEAKASDLVRLLDALAPDIVLEGMSRRDDPLVAIVGGDGKVSELARTITFSLTHVEP
jgi:hypothetical protein